MSEELKTQPGEVEAVDQLFKTGEAVLQGDAPPLRQKSVGGRPPGRKDSRPRRKPGTAAASEAPQAENSEELPPAAVPAKKGDYLDLSKWILPLPFFLLAKKFDDDLFLLSPEEIEAGAPALDAVLVKRFPYMAESSPEMVLAAVLFSIGSQKWSAYQEKQKLKASNVKNPSA